LLLVKCALERLGMGSINAQYNTMELTVVSRAHFEYIWS